MNTLTISLPSESKSKASQKPIERSSAKGGAPGELNEGATGAWYRGFEMGMEFCRLTERLADERGTKIDKELRSLEQLLARSFAEFFEHEELNLLDLGTGDGQKMNLVVRTLNEAGIGPLRYVPVDTNPYISRYASFTILGSGKKGWSRQEAEFIFGPLDELELAGAGSTELLSIRDLVQLSRSCAATSELFSRKDVIVPITGLEIDFFQNLPQVLNATRGFGGAAANLFCMLGNTFGNYSAEERRDFLTTLSAEMNAGELFLLGVSLRPAGPYCSAEEIRHLEREHLPAEAFMRLAADEPGSKFHLRYDRESQCMIYGFQRHDQSMQDMGFSQLFQAEKVVSDLAKVHLDVVACETYPAHDDRRAPTSSDWEPRYLTLLTRKKP